MANNKTKIQVFGSGCPSCKQLFKAVQEAVEEMKLDAAVEYIDDIEKLLALGVMSSPVLVINDSVITAGSVPNKAKIKELVSVSLKMPPQEAEISKKCGGCSCGGSCC